MVAIVAVTFLFIVLLQYNKAKQRRLRRQELQLLIEQRIKLRNFSKAKGLPERPE